MANQTVSVNRNLDDAAISGLTSGEQITVNTGATLTINSDNRWSQQAAVVGNIVLDTATGGNLYLDGRDVWQVEFNASTGNVPALGVLGALDVTGGTSGATGEFLGVWATGEFTPRTAGGAMPTSGFIKLRRKIGDFTNGEILTLSNGATATVDSATGGRRSWIQVSGARQQTITVPRLGTFQIRGDWYELGTTSGADDQTFQLPVTDACPAVWVETASGSNEYEIWLNAGFRWNTATQYVPTDVRGKYFGQWMRKTGVATTSGSPVVTLADTTGLVVGAPIIMSAGFSDGDNLYIVSIVANTSVTVSVNSNATGTGRTLDSVTSTIEIARRASNSCGFKPSAGCKVRVPNVIVSNSGSPWAGNTLESQSDRWELVTTAGGVIDFDKTWFNGYINCSAAYQVSLTNSSTGRGIVIANTGSTTYLNNFAIGLETATETTNFNLTVLFSGLTMINCRGSRYAASGATQYTYFITDVDGLTITGCQADMFGSTTAVTNNNSDVRALNLERVFTFDISGCSIVGAKVLINQSKDGTIRDTKYAAQVNGITNSSNAVNAAIDLINTSSNILIDGFTNFGGLSGVCPYSAFVNGSGSSSNIEVRNIGTPSTPFDCQTITGTSATFATVLNITMRRIYLTNTRNTATNGAVSLTNTVQNVLIENIWGDYTDGQTISALNTIIKGARWTNNTSTTNAVYGTHWYDTFISSTAGRVVLQCHEPLESTAAQAIITSGTPRYNSANAISLPTSGDQVVWEMPYYALGHTGLGVLPPIPTGTNVSLMEYDYQIDTGSGFSAWKRLGMVVVRNTGGASGTNSVVINAVADPQPQIGYYAQASGGTRLPVGTTITNVVGTTITFSNNFTSSMGANELLYLWTPDLESETFSETTGFKLKVRVTAKGTNTTTALNFLSIPTVTNSTAQLTQYPLPVIGRTLTLTGLQAGTEVRLIRQSDLVELDGNESISGTYSYSYEYTSDLPIYIVIFALGYQPQRLSFTLGDEDTTIPIQQVIDRQYNNP